METQYELEMTIISGIWSIEKTDFKHNASMFPNTTPKYHAVLDYLKAGNPPGNILLSKQILGADLTKELMEFEKYVSEATIGHYSRQLAIHVYNRELSESLTTNQIDIELLEKGINIYSQIKDDGNTYDLYGDLHEYLNDYGKRFKKEIPMYKIGYGYLDNMIYPIEPGTFIIIKALKKTGKTNLAVNIFINMMRNKIPCLYLTSEMDYFKIVDKLASITGNLSASDIRKGEEPCGNVTKAITDKVAGMTGNIHKSGMFDVEKISDLIVQKKAKVIFVDYLQMFRVSDDNNRAESLEKIACQIKDIAMSLGVVFIGMSQVNKEGDTKHCLSFEEKADQVMYMKTTDDVDTDVKTFDVGVEYNRYGITGVVKMTLDRRTCRIYETDKSTERPICNSKIENSHRESM